MKLVYFVTEDWYFLSHRLPMARAAQRAGFDIVLIARDTGKRATVESEGVRMIPVPFDRRGLNPFQALKDILALIRIYRREKPDVVHHIAMKPVLYGSLAAAVTKAPVVVNAFPGLGYVFTARTFLAKTLRSVLVPVFRYLLRRKGSFLLLQNEDDRALLSGLRLTPEGRTIVIRGSGIELERWRETPLPSVVPHFICVFAGRMIGIKGLETLKAAFAQLEQSHPQVRLWLCGAPDPANPGSWSEAEMQDWAQAFNIVYKGPCVMETIWPQAHLALQPSWGGEGIPKAMLEAAACGRPFVATNVPGCREVAKDGVNGFLIPPRDAEALAQAIARLANDEALCRGLASNSRSMIQAELSAEAVTAQTESLYQRCRQAVVDKDGITVPVR